MGWLNILIPFGPTRSDRIENESATGATGTAAIEQLLENLPEVVFRVDRGGTWKYLNGGWKILSGYTSAESVGRDCTRYVHPEDRAAWTDYLRAQFVDDDAATMFSMRILRCTGDPVWVEARCNTISVNEDGLASRQVIGTLTDINQHVEQENLTRAGHRALETIVADVPAMIYRCRANALWTMEFCSAGCRDLTGYFPDDLTNNQKLPFVELIHMDDRQRVWNWVQAALREDRPFNVTYRLITAQGEEKWVLDAGRGNYTASGELLTIDGFIVELTSWKRYEEGRTDRLLYDVDTGLPNRSLFTDRLKQRLMRARKASGSSFALLLLQIDRFEGLKKKYPIGVAERAVTEVGNLLRGHIVPPDTIARIEPAGFGILVEAADGYDGVSAVTKICKRLEELVLTPIRIDDHQIFITASIGVSLSDSGYATGDDMIMDAATALSRASNLGGGRYEVFDLKTHAQAAAWSQMATELELAAERNELEVLAQPIVDASDGKIAGLEARLVWNHPRHGQLLAEDFVPIADESQYVVPLWEWMIARVAKHVREWYECVAPEQMSVNIYIHGKSLLDTNVMLRLAEELASVSTPRCRLSLGIPESILMQPDNLVEEILNGVDNGGLQLVVDGFGTGLLAPAVLRRMSISAVKLNPELVEEAELNTDIIRAITAYAHSLGIDVIASQVSSAGQRRVLEASGVDYLQGPAIAALLHASDVVALFNRQPVPSIAVK